MNKRLFDLIVLGLWFFAAIIVYIRSDIYINGYNAINSSIRSSEKEFSINQIFVLDSNLFEIVFDKDQTVTAKTELDVSLDKDEVLSILRNATDPKFVFVFKQPNDIWLVKINFFDNGKRTTLDKSAQEFLDEKRRRGI